MNDPAYHPPAPPSQPSSNKISTDQLSSLFTSNISPKNATAALGSSTGLLGILRGVGKNTADVALQEGDQMGADLSKNAQVQESGAGAGTKIGSEAETGANLAGDFANLIFSPITGAVKSLSDAASDNPEVQKFAQSPAVAAMLDKNSALSQKMNDWAKANPDAARTLGDVFSVAGLVAGGEGGEAAAGKAGEIAADTSKGGSDVMSAAKQALTKKQAAGAEGKIAEMVSPRLTPTEAESAVAGGRVSGPKGLMRDIKIDRPLTGKDGARTRLGETVDALKGIVKPGSTFSQNAKAVGDAIMNEAEDLKTKIKGEDHPYTYKELNSRLSNVEKPSLIKTGDKTIQKQARAITNKFLEIARSKKGDISSLLDTRKEFDAWVAKEYPNLYDSDAMTGIRLMVKGIRDEANTFISENLSDDLGYQDSLKKQTLMYDAKENLAEKAAKGAPHEQGEIGTNVIQRLSKRHPKATKAAGTAATVGTSILLGEEAAKNIP